MGENRIQMLDILIMILYATTKYLPVLGKKYNLGHQLHQLVFIHQSSDSVAFVYSFFVSFRCPIPVPIAHHSYGTVLRAGLHRGDNGNACEKTQYSSQANLAPSSYGYTVVLCILRLVREQREFCHRTMS